MTIKIVQHPRINTFDPQTEYNLIKVTRTSDDKEDNGIGCVKGQQIKLKNESMYLVDHLWVQIQDSGDTYRMSIHRSERKGVVDYSGKVDLRPQILLKEEGK